MTHHIHHDPAGENIVQRIVNAWDCCGTCAGGVYAAAVRALVERAKAEGAREALLAAADELPYVGVAGANWLRARADSLAAQPATEEGCSSCGLYGGGHAHPDCEGAQPAPEAATVEEQHCPTCACGCTCGYGGLHEPENPNCDLVRRKP